MSSIPIWRFKKMNLIKILLYCALFVLIYALKLPAAYFVAYAALVITTYGRTGEKKKYRLIPPVGIGIYLLLVHISFSLFKTSYAAGFLIFTMSSAAVLGLFFTLSGGSDRTHNPEPEKKNIFITVVKLVVAAALGIAAWYLLKFKINIASVLVYAASLVMLAVSFSYGKIASVVDEQDVSRAPVPASAPAKEQGGGIDFDGLFSIAFVVLLVLKAVYSFTNFNFKEPVIFMAMAIFISGAVLNDRKGIFTSGRDGHGNITAVDFLIMTVLFLGAFFIRIHLLEMPGTSGDDSYILIHVARSLSGDPAVFSGDPTIIGPTMLFWIIGKLIVFTQGQINLITARLLSALMGSFSVVFMYLMALELFRRRVAVVTGVITAVMFIHIMYSRQTIGVIEVVTFSAFAFYYMLRGIRMGGMWNWILSGFGVGLGLYFYNPSKFVPIIIALFLLLYLLMKEKKLESLKAVLPGFLIITITSVIIYFPILEYAVTMPNVYFERISYASAFQNVTNLTSYAENMVTQIKAVLQFIFYNNIDYSGLWVLPGVEIFNKLETYLFMMGFCVVIFYWKKPANMLLVIWLILGLFPAIYSWSYSASGFRGLLALPALIIIVALGLEFIISSLEKAMGKPAKMVSPVIAAVALLFIGYIDITRYFSSYMNDPNVKIRWYTNIYRMAEYSLKFKDTNVFMSMYYSSERLRHYQNIFDMKYIKCMPLETARIGFSELYNDKGKAALILSESMDEKNILIYREYFPNAEIKVFYNYEYRLFSKPDQGVQKLYGWKVPWAGTYQYNEKERSIISYDLDVNSKPYISFVSCYIPYEDIRNLYGFNARFYDGPKMVLEQRTAGEINVPSVKFDRIELEGLLDTRQYGKFAFKSEGADIASLAIEGKKQDPAGGTIIKGLNRIKVSLTGIKGRKIFLKWALPNTQYTAVPMGSVIQSDRIYGLLCRTKCSNGDEYLLKYYNMHQRYYWYYPSGEPCGEFDRTWNGFIRIDEAGIYKVIFRSAYEAAAFVNGAKVCETRNRQADAKEVFLAKGRHKIMLQEKGYKPYNGDTIQLLLQKKDALLPAEVTYDMLSYQP